MKHLLWAAVIILVAAMLFADNIEHAWDIHQFHSYELNHMDDGGSKL